MLTEQAFSVLKTTTLFAGFNDEQLAMVPKVALPHTFAPGEVIVEQGDRDARSLWLVLEGEVEVRVDGEPIRAIGPGNHFGEMALLTGAPRSADVIASTAVTTLELSRSHLHGLIGANPDVAIEMLAELARRLRRTTRALADAVHEAPDVAPTIAAAASASPTGRDILGPIEHDLADVDHA
jgi:CRP-like cAMP-binding protein